MSINGFPEGEFLIENEGLGLFLTLSRDSRRHPAVRLAEDSGEPSQYWYIDPDRHLVNLEELDGHGRCVLFEAGKGQTVHPTGPSVETAIIVAIRSIENGAKATKWRAEDGYIFAVGSPDLVLTPGSKRRPIVLLERNRPNQRWTIVD